jgi:hypothetical protein
MLQVSSMSLFSWFLLLLDQTGRPGIPRVNEAVGMGAAASLAVSPQAPVELSRQGGKIVAGSGEADLSRGENRR